MKIQYGPKYPILSRIARDILVIPVFIVVSKSAFSTNRRVIDIFQSSLDSDIVEAVICFQDWLRFEKKDNLLYLHNIFFKFNLFLVFY